MFYYNRAVVKQDTFFHLFVHRFVTQPMHNSLLSSSYASRRLHNAHPYMGDKRNTQMTVQKNEPPPPPPYLLKL
jgi:hypothetical protein